MIGVHTVLERHNRRSLGVAVVIPAALGLAGVPALAADSDGPADSATTTQATTAASLGCPAPGEVPDGGHTQEGTDENVSLYAGGNYLASGGAAESEGLQVIVGDATYDKAEAGTFNVGTVGWGSGLWPSGDRDMLRVGGGLTVGAATSLHIGAGLDGGGNATIGGASNVSAGSANLDLHGGTLTAGLGADTALSPYADFGSRVDALSASLAARSATGSVDEDDPFLTFTGNGKDGVLQVFTVTAERLAHGGAPRFVDVGDDTTPIVINVTGTDVTYVAQDTYVGDDGMLAAGAAGFGTWSSRILWNYPEATTLDLGGSTQFIGSIVAPRADAVLTPSTNGRLYVGGDLTVSGSGQKHHSFPWIGSQTTECVSGSFAALKVVTGEAASSVPADTTFVLTCTVEDGPDKGTTGTLGVRADGLPVYGPDLHEGSVVAVQEQAPPQVPGITWGESTISPHRFTVSSGATVRITVTNTADKKTPEPEVIGTPEPEPEVSETPGPGPEVSETPSASPSPSASEGETPGPGVTPSSSPTPSDDSTGPDGPVSPSSPAESAESEDGLATTGFSSAPILAGAVFLALAGAAFLATRRNSL